MIKENELIPIIKNRSGQSGLSQDEFSRLSGESVIYYSNENITTNSSIIKIQVQQFTIPKNTFKVGDTFIFNTIWSDTSISGELDLVINNILISSLNISRPSPLNVTIAIQKNLNRISSFKSDSGDYTINNAITSNIFDFTAELNVVINVQQTNTIINHLLTKISRVGF